MWRAPVPPAHCPPLPSHCLVGGGDARREGGWTAGREGGVEGVREGNKRGGGGWKEGVQEEHRLLCIRDRRRKEEGDPPCIVLGPVVCPIVPSSHPQVGEWLTSRALRSEAPTQAFRQAHASLLCNEPLQGTLTEPHSTTSTRLSPTCPCCTFSPSLSPCLPLAPSPAMH